MNDLFIYKFRERENEVFGLKKKSSIVRFSTTPKPFKLSYQNSKVRERQELLKKQRHEMEMKECTFHPNTMEGQNRKMIQMILKN